MLPFQFTLFKLHFSLLFWVMISYLGTFSHHCQRNISLCALPILLSRSSLADKILLSLILSAVFHPLEFPQADKISIFLKLSAKNSFHRFSLADKPSFSPVLSARALQSLHFSADNFILFFLLSASHHNNPYFQADNFHSYQYLSAQAHQFTVQMPIHFSLPNSL